MNYLTILPLGFALLTALALEGWSPVNSGYVWKFPEDHWAKRDYKTEWWYLTGHLDSTGPERRRFGYQFTFFRIGVTPERLELDSDWASGHMIMGHAAISDLDQRKHWFSEVLYRENSFLGGFPGFPDPLIAWSLGPPGTNGKWSLRWNGQAFDIRALDQRQGLSMQLSTSPLKPRVFQGPSGISPKGDDPSSASLYYSFTRLETLGNLEVDGRTYAVEGESWMDKEISSNILSDDQMGWDWFSLQFKDGRELMLFQLRDRQGESDFSWATLISAEGIPSYFRDGGWNLEPLELWESPSGAEYPSGWSLRFPELTAPLEISPAFPDQENRSRLVPGLDYWEGAVEVVDSEGQLSGRGYAELTGYLKGGRLPL